MKVPSGVYELPIPYRTKRSLWYPLNGRPTRDMNSVPKAQHQKFLCAQELGDDITKIAVVVLTVSSLHSMMAEHIVIHGPSRSDRRINAVETINCSTRAQTPDKRETRTWRRLGRKHSERETH